LYLRQSKKRANEARQMRRHWLPIPSMEKSAAEGDANFSTLQTNCVSRRPFVDAGSAVLAGRVNKKPAEAGLGAGGLFSRSNRVSPRANRHRTSAGLLPAALNGA
jgi:hypothetical protein